MSRVWSEAERSRMRRAIDLARPHRTHPNPRVGCVIVGAGGKVVGEGAHRGVGTPHAEAVALSQAGGAARDSTAFVTLEPCSHSGRTPPCADALVAAGVKRVVIAAYDPDARVRGRGVVRLQRAGIEAVVGLMGEEAVRLDIGFHHHRRTGLPYVRAVVADAEARADEAVSFDIAALIGEADHLLATTNGPALPSRRKLAGLAERGHLYLAIEDVEVIGALRRAGLVDAASHYARIGEDHDGLWTQDGLRVMDAGEIGAAYRRIDLERPPAGWPPLVCRRAEAAIPTRYGRFRAIGYESLDDGRHHVALVKGRVAGEEGVLVRMHSECLTGDVFASLRCDCGFQMQEAMRRIGEAGRGVILYMRGHEGRGIGLIDKLAAYALQEQGRDTVEANLDLGLPEDSRDYGAGARMLADLGVNSLRLLTNNPAKRAGVEAYGVRIVERVPLVAGENDHNRTYLRTKVAKLGHVIDLEAPPPGKVRERTEQD
ncbi:MAG: GTP cyclohydrolase II [bacterium]|nr:GTP cyclohydrolase II [bacterium]MDE0351741.1 GTP cyclohydrolase II [bacterium]